MKKPTQDELYLLTDLVLNSEATRVLVDALERQVISVEQDLVRSSLLDSVEDEKRIIRLKHEAQAARKLFQNFKAYLESVRMAALKADVKQ